MKLLNKILVLFISLIVLLSSCERKPLYLSGDCRLNINVTTEVSIETYWNPTWKDSLIYNWDESKYGPMFYTKPENIELVIFHGSEIVKKRTLKTGKRQLIDVDLDQEYDFLIYNKTFEVSELYSGGRYYLYTPSTTTKSNPLDEKYETVFQPGEIFSTYKENIFLSSDVGSYEEVYDNGKLVYVYNIDATIKPVSWIYIIQFIIVNDDHTVIEAKDITDFTISGVCDMKNLFTQTPKYNGLKQVSTFDVNEGQEIADSLVFTSRVTIFDLIPSDESTSWTSFDNYLYYSGIDILTHTLGSVSGIVDITKQMNANPTGGIITVRILNSDIKKAASTEDGYFGINIKDWDIHHIDIDF